MWFQSFLPYYIFHLKLCSKLYFTRFMFSKESNRIVEIRSSFRKAVCDFQILCHTCVILGTSYQLLFGKLTSEAKIQGMVTYVDYLIFLVTRHQVGVSETAPNVINQFLQFEEAIPEDLRPRVSSGDKFCLFLLKYLLFQFAIRPICNIALFLQNPCFLPYVASNTGFCQNGTWVGDEGYKWKLPMLLFDFWMGCSIYFEGISNILYLFQIPSVCIVDYLTFIESVLRGKGGRNHKSVDQRHTKTLLAYRGLLLLHKHWNSYIRLQIVPAIVSIIPIIQISANIIVITSHGKIPPINYGLFVSVALGTASYLIVTLTIASKIFTHSEKLLKEWSFEIVSFSRSTAARKELMSCRSMRVEFGSNFLDNGTPFVVEDFAIRQTVSILMMKNK